MKLVPLALFCAGSMAYATWPAIPAATDLLKAVDHASTTLGGNITSSDTSITLASSSHFVPGQVIVIDSEQIKICAVPSDVVTVCSGGRGYAGTTAAAHTSGATVKNPVLPIYYQALASEIAAFEADKFGAIGSTIGSTQSAGPGTVSWPYNAASLTDLYGGTANASTALTADLDASSLSLTVATVANFGPNQLATVDTELMRVCSASGTTITICAGGRGAAGSTAAAHTSGAAVKVKISAELFRRIARELSALESDLFSDYGSGSTAASIAWPNHPATASELLTDCLPTLTAACHNKLAGEIIAFETAIAAGPIVRSVPGGAVELSPGDDVQAAVNSHGNGTTFYLHNGTYRLQSVNVKDGDTFTGETTTGAVMSGARVLTGWTASGSNWFVGGQTQQGDNVPGSCCCKGDHPRCSYPEDLFMDNAPLFHVANLGDLGPGKWYFDYGADRIYMRDNPSGHTMETSVSSFAFYGQADNVTIQNLTVEKYANPAQNGAILCAQIENRAPQGHNWVVKDNIVRLNHGSAVFASDRMQILRNKIFKNGQMGLSGDGDAVLVQDNEISFNNFAGYDPGWEAGGTKFVGSTNIVMRGNYSHDNIGSGLWLDFNNSSFLIENNHTQNNMLYGITQEIGQNGIIRNNLVENEGSNPGAPSNAMWYSGGIVVSASPGVEVYGNTVKNSVNGIGAIQADRGGGFLVKNLSVHDNTIVQNGGVAAGIIDSTNGQVFSFDWNNHFQHNTYTLTGGAAFAWGGSDSLSTGAWTGTGNDTTGTFH